jgi:hypothetical protein
LLDRSEGTAVEFFRHRFGAREVGVHDADQTDRLSLLCQLMVNTRMITPKGADTDDSNGGEILICQGKLQARCLGEAFSIPDIAHR